MTPANKYFSKIDQHIQFLEKILQKLSVDENQTLNRRVLEEALIVLRQY